MRAAIFNPYLDTQGGGERYTLSFAKVLSETGYIVDIEWHDKSIIKKLEERFSLPLKNINIVSDINRGDGYDLCFWVSDGSIPLLKSRKNILHFQFPFTGVNGNTLLNKMKLFRINKIIVNSNFTKNFIDREYGVNSMVLYPPVPVNQIKPLRKENIILYVGRFSNLTQNKHQDILIDSFKNFFDSGSISWKLILAGGIEVGADQLLPKLKEMSVGYPVEFAVSPSFNILKNLYGKSKIFWSAAGFEIDELQNPKQVEHFGISVVEAMSGGAVPIIYNAGGHKEIIQNNENGYLWNSVEELINLTVALNKDSQLVKKISSNSIKSSKLYNYEIFKSEVLQFI